MISPSFCKFDLESELLDRSAAGSSCERSRLVSGVCLDPFRQQHFPQRVCSPTFAEPVISPGYDKALSKDDAPGNFFPGSFINFCDSCPGNIHLGSTLLVSFLLQIYQTDDFIFIQSQSDSFRLSGTFFRRKRFILGSGRFCGIWAVLAYTSPPCFRHMSIINQKKRKFNTS